MKKRMSRKILLAVVLVLALLIAAASFVITGWINREEEERSYELLSEETERLAGEIRTEIRGDTENLRMLAAVIAAGDTDLTSPEVRSLLGAYSTLGMISRVELLLPDDTVVTKSGQSDASGVLSFSEEAAKGVHVSRRETDPDNGGKYILRSYVPVEKDGETVAMLYGVIEPGTLPGEMAAEPYGGEAAVYIIEGQTGDFLVDTWHNEAGGNIWALGERKMAPGYNHEQLKAGMTEGKTGYVVFVSDTTGEYLYFYYEPVGINDWQLALSVPEKVVFENAERIRLGMNLYLVFETVCFVIGVLWIFRYMRSETKEKQAELDTVNSIYDMEKLLFDAHENEENVSMALERVARITTAKSVSLWISCESGLSRFFSWQSNGSTEPWNKETMTELRNFFRSGSDSFEKNGMTAIPVRETDGRVCGVLAAQNAADHFRLALLKSMGYSFSMFSHNLRQYALMKKQGEMDLLCGLYNRNRYEMDRERIQEIYTESIACIYLDVNGLHELNNSRGHEAGDLMLKSVAEKIAEYFDRTHAYRIGGDEFVVFVPDTEESVVQENGRRFVEELEQENISISMGIQWDHGDIFADKLTKSAEQKMYAAKREYYGQEAHDRRRRK